MLLDDELDIVAIFMLALEGHGFNSVGFTEPLLALEHFQKNSEKYGLVISDLRMQVIKEVNRISIKSNYFLKLLMALKGC
jgi:DNA-binding NtrC family response regulator